MCPLIKMIIAVSRSRASAFGDYIFESAISIRLLTADEAN